MNNNYYLKFEEDLWLSSKISKNAYNLNINNFNEEICKKEWENFLLENSKNTFIAVKIFTNEINISNFLCHNKFRLVDTNILFLNDNCTTSSNFENNDVRFAIKNDEKILSDIAYNNFETTRFHLDKKIIKKIANNIKSHWLKNYFNGKRGTHLIVSLENNIPVGFLLLIKKNDNLIIDLICVDKNFQKKQKGRKMFNFMINNFKFKNIYVGTQISNKNSISFYEKLNFKIFETKYIFHYHN